MYELVWTLHYVCWTLLLLYHDLYGLCCCWIMRLIWIYMLFGLEMLYMWYLEHIWYMSVEMLYIFIYMQEIMQI